MPITALIPDILSHISTFLNKFDMQIIKDNVVFDEPLCCHIISSGYLNMLKWMPRYYDEYYNMCDISVETNNLDIIIWAHEHFGYKCSPWIFNNTTINGDLEILQWMHANDYELDKRTCSTAAKHGHLHILQWARANDCPWDADTIKYARKNGHTEMLNWALANGCPDN